jgi:hypothetical protein
MAWRYGVLRYLFRNGRLLWWKLASPARTASVHAFGVERRHDRRNFTFLPCYPPEW